MNWNWQKTDERQLKAFDGLILSLVTASEQMMNPNKTEKRQRRHRSQWLEEIEDERFVEIPKIHGDGVVIGDHVWFERFED